MSDVELLRTRRSTEVQLIRSALIRAGVSKQKIEKVVQEELKKHWLFGTVTAIQTEDAKTRLIMQGTSEEGWSTFGFHFPPNSQKYLTEIVRAQSNQLTESLTTTLKFHEDPTTHEMIIEFCEVRYMPPNEATDAAVVY